VDACGTDAECARASLALTMCMAGFACPLQHGALKGVLEEGEEGGKVDVALDGVVDCVQMFGEKAVRREAQR
jgi:hypothetical protein